MSNLINDDFLLKTNSAKKLYHDYAKDMPILDYHNHINPKEVVNDKKYENISKAWLKYDHYKWRAMRISGISERGITGDADDYEKFKNFAKVMSRLINSPIYHWTHLELKRFFDIDDTLCEENAKEIYQTCNEALQGLSAQCVLNKQKVQAFCTTDDVCDDLKWHKKSKEISEFEMLPTFRADSLFNIDADGFVEYVKKIAEITNKEIVCLSDFYSAIEDRLNYFQSVGCKVSDQGVMDIPCEQGGDIDTIFKKALGRQSISELEINQYKTAMLLFLGAEYRKRNFVMQYRFGVCRNNSTFLLETIGRDAGGDAIAGFSAQNGVKLAKILDLLQKNDALPKTILYSLNPYDNAIITSVLGCFTNSEYSVTQGSGWWFNDTKAGMISQLSNFAEHCALGDFVGMVTDSRSLFSFVRHEYFRRIICNLIGGWIEDGEYANDLELAGGIVKDICYYNTKKLFNFII